MTTTLIRDGYLQEAGTQTATGSGAAGTLAGEPTATASATATAVATADGDWGRVGGRAPGWLESRCGRRLVGVTLLAEIALVSGFALVYRPFDLQIYLWGGRAVTEGLRLYLVAPQASWFTYPPFAAALFTPLAAMPAAAVRVVWELASIGALTWASLLTLRLASYRTSGTVVAAMVAAGLMLEPMYHTLFLGQINLYLLALVLTDVWRAARGRPAGIAVGIATAIKLTPGVFILLFLFARRARDAVTGAVTFAYCTLIGFLIDPAASRLYWTRLFYDTRRVGGTYISNQSPYGAVARWLGGVGHVGAWYAAVPAVIAVLGIAVAAILARRDDWLGAAAMTGTTGLLVSPISWTHHWVWVMPALVVLLRGGRRSRVAAALAFAVFALAPMWWTPHSGQTGDYGTHGVLTLAANCFLISGLAFMIYLTVHVWRSGPRVPWSRPDRGNSWRAPDERFPASEWV